MPFVAKTRLVGHSVHPLAQSDVSSVRVVHVKLAVIGDVLFGLEVNALGSFAFLGLAQAEWGPRTRKLVCLEH